MTGTSGDLLPKPAAPSPLGLPRNLIQEPRGARAHIDTPAGHPTYHAVYNLGAQEGQQPQGRNLYPREVYRSTQGWLAALRAHGWSGYPTAGPWRLGLPQDPFHFQKCSGTPQGSSSSQALQVDLKYLRRGPYRHREVGFLSPVGKMFFCIKEFFGIFLHRSLSTLK